MIRRTALALLVGAVTMLAVALPLAPGAPPAGAQYIPGVTSFILDPPLVGPGDTVFAIGSGCPPGSPVHLLIEDRLVGEGVAGDDEGGSFEIPFAAPREPGEYEVEMRCGGETDVQILTVVESPCGFIIEGVPGAPVTFSAGGFVEGTGYSLIFQPMGRVVATGTIDIDPHLFDFQIPQDATAGDHLLIVEGVGRNNVPRDLECPVVVTTDPLTAVVAPADELPVAGGEVSGFVQAGAALLAIGGLLLLAARRRTALS